MTNSILEDLARVEGKVLPYLVAGVFVLALLNPIVPTFSLLVDKNPVGVVAFLIISTSRLLQKSMLRLETLTKLHDPSAINFNKHIEELIEARPRIKVMKFLATDANRFLGAVANLDFSAESVKILVCDSIKHDVVDRWKPLLERWHSISGSSSAHQDQSRCRSLEIKTYSLRPAYYAMILDGKEGVMGFFKPAIVPEGSPPPAITGPYRLSSAHPTGGAMLTDVEHCFDEIFEHYSEELFSECAS